MPVNQSVGTLLVFLYYKESHRVAALSEAIAPPAGGYAIARSGNFSSLEYRNFITPEE